MTYELKSLSFGETIGKAFNLFIDNFIPLFLICLVLQIPFYLLLVVIQSGNILTMIDDLGLRTTVILSSAVVILVFLLFIQSLQTGVIVKFVANKYLGEKIVFNEFLHGLKSSILPLCGLAIIFGLIIMLGFLVFIVPGLILMFNLILATQVLVIEKKKITESLARSWKLTKGMWLRIFGWWLIIYLITLIINTTASQIITTLFGVFGLTHYLVIAGISVFIQSLTAPLLPCILVLVYFNARIEKEGFAVEHLAEQFSRTDSAENQETV